MPSPDDIKHQLARLADHRITLGHYRAQEAKRGSAHTSPEVTHGIREACAEIVRIKGVLRGWGEQVEDLPDDPPESCAVASAAPLQHLVGQLATAEVRQELGGFQAIFRMTRDQIALISCYKDLHDTLQEFERPFLAIVRQRRRFATEREAWDDCYEQMVDVQDFSTRLERLLTDARIAAESLLGRQQLQQASLAFTQALQQNDARALDKALRHYQRLLDRELPRADTSLVRCAGALQLQAVIAALTQLHAKLAFHAQARGCDTLHDLITTLQQQDAALSQLVHEHHHWQAVDSELRRLTGDSLDDHLVFAEAWEDMLPLTMPLFGQSNEAWALELNQLSAAIVAALASEALPQARRHFIKYQRLATSRFVTVDKSLLRTCHDLRETGRVLEVLL